MDVGDIRLHLLDQAPHPAGLERVPRGQRKRPGRAGRAGWVPDLVLDDLVAASPQQVRLGAHDGVLAARLPVPRVQLEDPHGAYDTPSDAGWRGSSFMLPRASAAARPSD
jgi:hypothetical protein